jgi:hypothetical protein
MQFTSVHEARGESKKEKNEKMFFSFFVPFLGVCEGPLSLWEKQNPKQFCYFLFFSLPFFKKEFPVSCVPMLHDTTERRLPFRTQRSFFSYCFSLFLFYYKSNSIGHKKILLFGDGKKCFY